MAYGRLDVFFPDGMFKTFLLTTSPVSIGRSTGNTIVLETETISRYHLSLAHENGQVTITDLESANGTFVEGERLKTAVPRPLYGGEEIQIGDLQLIFHNLDDNPTRPVPITVETQARHYEREGVDFKLDLDGPAHAIPPGAYISAILTISNTSASPDRFSIEIEGMPQGWTRIDRPELEIAGGAEAAAVLSFKPIRRHDTAPGEYSGKVTVRSKSRPEMALTCPIRLRVLAFSGFGIALAKRRLERDGQFRLYVQNQGSAPLPIALAGRDFNSRLRFHLPMSAMTLAPGQRASIDGQVRPRQPALFGEARTHPFDLIVRSCDHAGFLVAVRGYLPEKPMLPTWAGFALGGIGLALLALLVLIVLILLRPEAPPRIAAFNVDAARAAQGTPIGVEWAFADSANAANVYANGTLVYAQPAPARAGQFSLDTANLAGDVELRLSAQNRGGTAEAAQRVSIYAPLMVERFEIVPARLTRFVAQSIRISWSVSGAITTQLRGTEGWSSSPLQQSYGGSASVEIVGIPTAPVELILSAQSAEGEMLTQTVALPVIDPECVVRAQDTRLYVGPNSAHQVVSSPAAGTPLMVTAQDATGTWLRVRLSGGVMAWGERAAFDCADTFNPDDLVKELNVPPTPTPLPTITPPPLSIESLSAPALPTPTAAG
jgi:pSer/pThr/pTyr-binding forkhead associated (FHA) protein